MIKKIEQYYNNFVLNNLLTYDKRQVNFLKIITEIWSQNKKINFFLKKNIKVFIYMALWELVKLLF